jgi:hypothetical protein
LERIGKNKLFINQLAEIDENLSIENFITLFAQIYINLIIIEDIQG